MCDFFEIQNVFINSHGSNVVLEWFQLIKPMKYLKFFELKQMTLLMKTFEISTFYESLFLY